MQKRNVLNSPRLLELKKKRFKDFLNKILLCLLVVLIIFAGLAYLSQREDVNITSIEVEGNKVVETDAIKTSVQKVLAGNYLWFFPKTSIFLYPEKEIKRELADEFKRIDEINLSLKEDKILQIKLTERSGVYTWCGDTAEIADQKCYFLDDSGYIFDEAPYFSGDVYFKFYGEGGIGSYFSKENFDQLVYFKDALVAMKLKPVSLYVGADKDIKIFLSGTANAIASPYIILKSDSDFEKMAENLQTAIDTEPLKSNLKNKYASLRYIDLRFGNKVYYKFE